MFVCTCMYRNTSQLGLGTIALQDRSKALVDLPRQHPKHRATHLLQRHRHRATHRATHPLQPHKHQATHPLQHHRHQATHPLQHHRHQATHPLQHHRLRVTQHHPRRRQHPAIHRQVDFALKITKRFSLLTVFYPVKRWSTMTALNLRVHVICIASKALLFVQGGYQSQNISNGMAK